MQPEFHHGLLCRLLPFFLPAILVSATPARAQISVEVSPLRVELAAGPGSTTTQAITLTNSGKEPVRVRARLTDWDLSRDGAPQFDGIPEGGPFSATEWVRIAPPEQIVEPGKDGTVRFSLSVPTTTQPAGYRTGILFEFLPPSGDRLGRGREVQFRSRIATLIYVNIGEPPINIELTDLRIRPASEQMQVIAVLNNTSKRTVRTKGTLTLYDQAGKPVRQAVVPDVPLLPEREREVAITAFEASKPLPAGEYRVEVKIDVGMPALIVGETTLTVSK
jgi:P pilus assembly chaperone PapD